MVVGKKRHGLSLEQKRRFYLNAGAAEQVVKQDASEDRHIIYGARALNAQLPGYLQKYTEDFDIFVSGNPEKEARETERKLDTLYGGDYFYTKKGQYKDTWKVINKVTGRNIADYTKQRRRVKSVQVYGNKYAAISDIKKSIKKTLGDEANAYRFDKDLEALQRIRLGQGGFG